MMRRNAMWKKIWAGVLRRQAVRVVFVGPDAQADPRIEKAKEKAEVRPMAPEFFEAIRDFLSLAEEKQAQWSQVIKPKADAAMSALWAKLWKTEEGRRYQDLKAEVDRRKAQADGVCRKAEDGISQKILAGGKVVTFIKTNVLVGREDLLEQARQDIDRLKHELAEAKERLRSLEKGQGDAIERLNLLVVEELKTPGKRRNAVHAWLPPRRAGVDAVQEELARMLQIDEMMADDMNEVNRIVGEFVSALENVAAQEISAEELSQFESTNEPVDVPA